MAIEDIIPLDAFFSNKREASPNGKKKKKVDKEALASPMMRIPRMDVRVARDLIDIGVKELYELEGRAPDTVFEEIKNRKPDSPDWILPYLRMAVYFAENENANPKMLHPEKTKHAKLIFCLGKCLNPNQKNIK